VIAFFLFQVEFWPFFILPAQGFFNALIYFRSTTKQPRRGSSAEQSRSSSFFSPSLQQWKSFRRSFSKRRSTVSADPLAAAVVVRAAQEEDLQDLEAEQPIEEKVDRNGATEGSRIPLDSVEMELSRTTSEASLEL
jgi:hypothetical protein